MCREIHQVNIPEQLALRQCLEDRPACPSLAVMPASPSPSSDADEANSDTFGPLLAISQGSLVRLASRIARRVFQTPISSGKLIRRNCGAYNLVHVVELADVTLVVRVPATGWGSGMTATAAQALESQAATMRLIRKTTTVPVPEIYDLDTTANNEIGAPYICMSFLPGRRVSDVWFADSGTLSREELRLRILANLSKTMAGFSCLGFDKLGSVMEDKAGVTFIGPVYTSHDNEDGSFRIEASGPYASTREYLETHSALGSKINSALARAKEKVMASLLRLSPLMKDSQDGFVLCPPDFDSQNILVDEEGRITGIIDWDLAHTMPRRLGYARYPGWITRDWDPLMYGWPQMADFEDSPDTLERYRAFYNNELGKALGHEEDWEFTEKSHIAEAVWIATLNYPNRTEICRKLVEVAARADSGGDIDGLSVLFEIGEGTYSEEDWDALEAKLESLSN